MKLFLLLTVILFASFTFGQSSKNPVIAEKEVATTLQFLSSDAMKGRATFSPEIDQAASFIATEFKKAGLKPLPGSKDYLQSFSMVKSDVNKVVIATLDGNPVSEEQLICQTDKESVSFNNESGYEVVRVAEGENAMVAFRNIRGKKGNILVLMHTSQEPFFNRIKQNKSPRTADGSTILFVLADQTNAEKFNFNLNINLETLRLANVVGYLPGKSLSDEYVIFSGHYDHIGIRKPNEQGDSIYNGANDDASGTTAVMMLANYFSKLGNNERSVIFAAFTAEEIGGFGSQYFSKQFDPLQVKAMFNIEMIGTDSKWGMNSAYITGYDKTNMGELLQKNLEGTPFTFYPDPYPQQQLFYRSDNATLARLGVPAHTISTSKMDNEPHYHKASDEASTLDPANMTEIIKAIALSSQSIIAGKDTPTRVDTSQLR